MFLKIFITRIVQAFTSSGPAVKKYSNCKALYPCTIILSNALEKIYNNPNMNVSFTLHKNINKK